MIWLNGALIERGETDALNAGALLGWGVFTTLGVRGGAPLFWEQHAARLQRDAAAARVPLPFKAAQLRAGLVELIQQLQIADGLARITGARRGDGRWNAAADADWSIAAQSATLDLAGARVQVSPFRVASAAPLAGGENDFLLAVFARVASRARWRFRRSVIADRARLGMRGRARVGVLEQIRHALHSVAALRRIARRGARDRVAMLPRAPGPVFVVGADGSRRGVFGGGRDRPAPDCGAQRFQLDARFPGAGRVDAGRSGNVARVGMMRTWRWHKPDFCRKPGVCEAVCVGREQFGGRAAPTESALIGVRVFVGDGGAKIVHCRAQILDARAVGARAIAIVIAAKADVAKRGRARRRTRRAQSGVALIQT